MQNRSLHLVSALRLHSYPQADVRAAPHFFSLEEVSPQCTEPGFLQLLWIDESKTVRHGHNTATAAISSALSNSNKCERDMYPSTHFRVRRLTAFTSTLQGLMSHSKVVKPPVWPSFSWLHPRLSIPSNCIRGGKIILTKKRCFDISAKIIFYHMNECVHNTCKPKLF